MSGAEPCLTVLVLTEDSSRQAHTVWISLLKKAFQEVDATIGTHRIRFDPQTEPERSAMIANQWKAKKGHKQQVALRRAIATRILEDDPPGFVAFHIDGDRRWSDRAESENVQKFNALVREPVRLLLAQQRASEQVVASRLRRLLVVVPFYSVEAWLFQNIAVLRKICTAPEHTVLDAWEADRASIDEILKPKESLSVGANQNEVLATQGWPRNEAYRANASFAAFVDGLVEVEDLMAELEATKT